MTMNLANTLFLAIQLLLVYTAYPAQRLLPRLDLTQL